MPRGNEFRIEEQDDHDELIQDAVIFARACLIVGGLAVLAGLVGLDQGWLGTLNFLLIGPGTVLCIISAGINIWIRRERRRTQVVDGNVKVSHD